MTTSKPIAAYKRAFRLARTMPFPERIEMMEAVKELAKAWSEVLTESLEARKKQSELHQEFHEQNGRLLTMIDQLMSKLASVVAAEGKEGKQE